MLSCPLCQAQNEHVLFANDTIRIIHTTENPLVPGFCRVIWQEHVAEMSDLNTEQQQVLWYWVNKLEKAMRQTLNPKKMNLASFGTMVPHMHWHVIARFEDDAYYPDAIWSTAKHLNTPIMPDNWLQQLSQLLHQAD